MAKIKEMIGFDPNMVHSERIDVQMQKWNGYKKALIFNRFGSVQVDLMDRPTKFNDSNRTYTAYIHSLWVNEKARKNGLATRLMDAAEKLAKDTYNKEVYLEWNLKESPQWVEDWYFRRGYDDVEFGAGCALMVKKLIGEEGVK